jgi:hypothetical protein
MNDIYLNVVYRFFGEEPNAPGILAVVGLGKKIPEAKSSLPDSARSAVSLQLQSIETATLIVD